MKDFQSMKETVEQRLGFECEIREIRKPGNVVRVGLVVKTGILCPIFYLDAMLDKSDNEIIAFISSQIKEIRRQNLTDQISVNLHDYDSAKGHFFLRCVNHSNNLSYLNDKPYRIVADDIAAYVSIRCGFCERKEDLAMASTSVTFDMLEAWHVSFEEVYNAALANGFEPYVCDVNEMTQNVMKGILETPVRSLDELDPISITDDGIPYLFSITNKVMVNGASILAYPEALKKVSDYFAKDMIVIPSSTNEILVMPLNQDPDYENLQSMIREVNDTLAPDEILSDQPYFLMDGKIYPIPHEDKFSQIS